MYECEEALELKVPGWLQSGRWTSRVFEVLWKSWELSLTHCMLNITASQIVKIVLTSGSLFSTALFHSWFLAISFGMIKSWLIYGVLLIDGCQTLLPWGTGAGFPNFWIPMGKFENRVCGFLWSLSQPLSCTSCLLLLTFHQNQNSRGHGSPAIVPSLCAKLRRAPGHQMTGEEP